MNVQFVLAALAAIGGAWLIWQSVREHRPAWLAALGAYGFVAEFQPDAHFSRVLTAYGGVFGATDARSRPDRPLNGDLLRARSSSSAPAAAERTAGVTITCDRQDRRLSRHLT